MTSSGFFEILKGRRAAFLLLILLCGPACAIPKKTPVMAKIQGIDVTAEQLRLQVAAFQFDPLIGLLDLWAFSLQMQDFFQDGNGRNLFGNQQFVARRVSDNYVKEVSRFVESLGPSYNLEQAKAFVTDWVRRNPIENILFVRRSTNMSLAAYNQDKSLGSVLGGIDERMTDMSTRMNVIMQQMPKIGRWQGQLFIADQAHRPAAELFNTDKLGKQFQPAMKSFEKIADLAPQLPAFVEQQRIAIRQDVDALTQKILADVQVRTQQTLDDTEIRTKQIVDYIFIRVLAVLGVLAAIMIVFAVILRSRRPARPT